MRTASLVVLLGGLGLAAVLPAACAHPSPPPRQLPPPSAADEQPIAPRDLMVGLVLPQRDALVESLQLGPRTEDEWEAVRLSASLLHEASLALLRERPANDPVWGQAAGQMLKDGSSQVLAAVGRRDLPSARMAYEQMSRACATCHRECTAGERPLASR